MVVFRVEQMVIDGHVFTAGYSAESVLDDVDLRLTHDHSPFKYVDSEREVYVGYDESKYKVTITVEKV